MVETILGNVPSKSNCYRISTRGKFARLYKTIHLKAYENSFAKQIRHHKGLNITTHFKLFLAVYFPSRRSDIDNSLKVVLDCLEMAKAIKNDNLCYELEVYKRIDKENPRIEFELIPLEYETTTVN